MIAVLAVLARCAHWKPAGVLCLPVHSSVCAEGSPRCLTKITFEVEVDRSQFRRRGYDSRPKRYLANTSRCKFKASAITTVTVRAIWSISNAVPAGLFAPTE